MTLEQFKLESSRILTGSRVYTKDKFGNKQFLNPDGSVWTGAGKAPLVSKEELDAMVAANPSRSYYTIK